MKIISKKIKSDAEGAFASLNHFLTGFLVISFFVTGFFDVDFLQIVLWVGVGLLVFIKALVLVF